MRLTDGKFGALRKRRLQSEWWIGAVKNGFQRADDGGGVRISFREFFDVIKLRNVAGRPHVLIGGPSCPQADHRPARPETR